jgi:hypothetical protein
VTFTKTSSSGNEYTSYEDKKALPELLLKQQIAIIDRGLVITAFKTLEKNKRMNNGIISQIDKGCFEAELAGLFTDIRNMIKSKKRYTSMNDYEKRNYNNLVKLVDQGYEGFKLSDLVSMMNYLMRMLHDLNLTNLLINERGPFDDWKNNM